MNRQVLKDFILVVFIALFLADAINVDELFGASAILHEDETSVVDQSSALSGPAVHDLVKPVGYSNLPRTPGKIRLELVDIDSPSLEAAYVSRDEISPVILSARTPNTPASAQTEPSFYSLGKLQI